MSEPLRHRQPPRRADGRCRDGSRVRDKVRCPFPILHLRASRISEIGIVQKKTRYSSIPQLSRWQDDGRNEQAIKAGKGGTQEGGRQGGRTRALQHTVTSRTFIRIRACLPRLDDIRHFPVPASLAAEMQYYAIQKCASVKVFTQPILLRYFTRERGGVELGDAGVVTLREEPDTGRIYF